MQIYGTFQFNACQRVETPFIGTRMEIFMSPSCIHPTTLSQRSRGQSLENVGFPHHVLPDSSPSFDSSPDSSVHGAHLHETSEQEAVVIWTRSLDMAWLSHVNLT